MLKKPKQKFSFLFEWDIWKIVFDNALPQVAIETRNLESRSIQYLILDLNHQLVISSLELPVDWWSTLAGFNKDILVIQKFRDSKFPDPKGYLCFDTQKKEMALDDKNGAFAFFSSDKIISTRLIFEQIIYESFDPKRRKIEELSGPPEKITNPPEIKIAIPLQYNDSSIHFNTINKFMKKYINKDAVVAVDYLEANSFIIVSYYIRAFEKLDNFILITDTEGVVLENLLIGSELEGVSKDPFFVRENQLYFVKNKKELQSYEL